MNIYDNIYDLTSDGSSALLSCHWFSFAVVSYQIWWKYDKYFTFFYFETQHYFALAF